MKPTEVKGPNYDFVLTRGHIYSSGIIAKTIGHCTVDS